MKQKLQIVTAIVAILIGLTACQKTTKDQLIGTWHCTATTTIDGGIINIEGTEEFLPVIDPVQILRLVGGDHAASDIHDFS